MLNMLNYIGSKRRSRYTKYYFLLWDILKIYLFNLFPTQMKDLY